MSRDTEDTLWINTNYGKTYNSLLRSKIKDEEAYDTLIKHLIFSFPQLKEYKFTITNVLNNEIINNNLLATKLLNFCSKENEWSRRKEHLRIDILPSEDKVNDKKYYIASERIHCPMNELTMAIGQLLTNLSYTVSTFMTDGYKCNGKYELVLFPTSDRWYFIVVTQNLIKE
jgi:hypothetical protein